MTTTTRQPRPSPAAPTRRPMFEFPVSVDDLFEERTEQFAGWGIPTSVVRDVRARTTDPWVDGPGGWTHEWVAAARALEQRDRWLEAALVYGAARFPSLASPARVEAYERQQAAFARATRRSVQREVLEVPYRGGTVPVPVHRYRCWRPNAVLCLTGGVDTWKVELHRLARALRTLGRLEIVLFDMPGTGESSVPLEQDAEEIYLGVSAASRSGSLPVGVMGMSMGGLWAAKCAMRGGVDFAVDLGGPVGASERTADDVLHLPNGMTGIVAHALWLDDLPTPDDLPRLLARFSLADELAAPDPHLRAPLLVVNGTEDQYIPRIDVDVFEQYPEATVWPVEGTTHCAVEKIVPVMVGVMAWTRQHTRRSTVDRMLTSAAATLL